MSSKLLGKLEELAGRRADNSRHVLEKEQQKLSQLEHHSSELRSINQEYQHTLVGGAEVAPQQLAHRRAFVERLTQRLEELEVQGEQRRQSVAEKASQFRKHTAQHTAIEIVNDQRTEAGNMIVRQRQQQQLDEAAAIQHIERKRTDEEQDS